MKLIIKNIGIRNIYNKAHCATLGVSEKIKRGRGGCICTRTNVVNYVLDLQESIIFIDPNE